MLSRLFNDFVCRDGFPVRKGNALKAFHKLIDDYYIQVDDHRKATSNPWSLTIKPKDYEAGRTILESDQEFQVQAVQALIERLQFTSSNKKTGFHYLEAYRPLLTALLRRNLPFGPDDLSSMLTFLRSDPDLAYGYYASPINRILSLVEGHIEQNGLDARIKSGLEALAKVHPEHLLDYSETRRILKRISLILGETKETLLQPGEPWIDDIISALDNMEQADRDKWLRLLEHAITIKGTRPPQKWFKEAREHLDAVGAGLFREKVLAWFSRIGPPTEKPMDEAKGDVLKGLVWFTSLLEDNKHSQELADLTLACYKKIPQWGPRSVKCGNACVQVLGMLPGLEPLSHLSRLNMKLRHAQARQLTAGILEKAAEEKGLSREDLEEMVIPTYGLDASGVRTESIGDFKAILRITDSFKTELRWEGPGGKEQKSIPAAIKDEFPDDIKALKKSARELESVLAAQRGRLEWLFLTKRSWPYDTWLERHLDHPVVAPFARRLVWSFRSEQQEALGMYDNGVLIDHSGAPLDWMDDKTTVSLWHPIHTPVEVVQSWRSRLEMSAITQPFKQAHREIYLVTDAELQTGTYSNRFASHILKQHQFAAICKQRGWAYSLQGSFDNWNQPTVRLPSGELSAEFWVEPMLDQGESDAGIALYIATDQVRFYDRSGDPMEVRDVPPLLLSEVMRDIDLFVSVCSVGSDPTWEDGGPQGRFATYWESYAFGELSASASTRKEALERLVPALKIAERCSFEDRFLVVRGDIKTYRIHLGSGNIQMAGNNQYLCIVPDSKRKGQGVGPIFLPFEGDHLLSVILSKAFLLAEDKKITDVTILNQLR